MHENVLPSNQYRIGWISAVQVEYAVAGAFLEEVYETPQLPEDDQNIYTCGRIGRHNVVIACLPRGVYGVSSATSVVINLGRSFPTVQYYLMVGIGGGAPLKQDVRLGDVVVGCPTNDSGGVIHYQFGKNIQGQSLKLTGFLNSAPGILLSAVMKLAATHMRKGSPLKNWVEAKLNEFPSLRSTCEPPGVSQDRLYVPSFTHPDGTTDCGSSCPQSGPLLIVRAARAVGTEIQVHHGVIASADQLMKDAISRDKLAETKDVICFEMEAAGIMNHKPTLVIRGICDYSDTHKNDAWQGYAAITAAAYARELLDVLPSFAPVMQSDSTNSYRQYKITRTAIFHRLFCLNYETILSNIPRAATGTGTWLVRHESYKEWRNSNQPALLYLTGPPGYGKSVNAAEVVRRYRERRKESQGSGRAPECDVIHYFFSNSVAVSSSQVTFLRSVLHQILIQRPQLADKVDDALDAAGLEDRRSVERPHMRPKALWQAIRVALSEDAPPKTLLVIDGVDEAKGEDAIDIIKGLLELGASIRLGETTTRFKIILTSRFDRKISEILRTESARQDIEIITFIDMRQEEMSNDIKIFLDNKVTAYGSNNGFSSSVVIDVKNAILQGADGMFLWAHLAWTEFIKDVVMWSPRTVRIRLEELQRLPKGVESLYIAILSRINSALRPRILSLMDYVIAAYRPLHHSELAVMMGILGDETTTKDIDTPFSLSNIIKDHCSSLLKIDHVGAVHVIHLSLKEFILHQENQKAQSIECKMARTCLHYLNLSDVRAAAKSKDTGSECVMNDSSFVCYPYASEHLAQHMSNIPFTHSLWLRFAKMVEDHEYYHIVATSDHFVHSISRQRQAREPVFSVITPLRIAVKLKSLELIDRLASVGYDMNERWSQLGARYDPYIYGSPDRYGALHAYIRDPQTVAKLLECGASPDIPDEYMGFQRHTPLQLAILSRESETVRVLLANPAVDVNLQDPEGKTALHYDTNNTYNSLILSDQRVNFGIADNNGRTALTYAIYWGNKPAAARMLACSPNVLAHIRRNLSPLVSAAKLDWKELTELMLDQVNDLTIHRGLDGKTVLHHAVINGWSEMVKKICGRSSIVNIRDNRGKTALHCAAELGQYQMVRQLIRFGASARIRDRLGRTAVHAAAVEGYADTIMPLILDSDYDVNATDGQRRSMLHWAATCDYDRIIQVVIGSSDVNLSLRDYYGRTALHVAALCGCPNVIRELLDLDHYDISQTDAFGNTLLHLAARSGSVTVLEMLLPKLSLHKNRVNIWGQTAMSTANAYGVSPGVIRLLTNYGVRHGTIRLGEAEKTYYTRRGGWEHLVGTRDNSILLRTAADRMRRDDEYDKYRERSRRRSRSRSLSRRDRPSRSRSSTPGSVIGHM